MTMGRTTLRKFRGPSGAPSTCGLSMVDTMALLPSFIRPTRMTKRPARPAGPPAADEAVLDAPDDRLSPALV
ncbi:hypothetical protein ACWC19_34600, partial [Streptomyces sp. 900105245]